MKAVIFDMDGVLIDTEKYLVKFWCQAGREFGYDIKREDALMIRSLAGKYAKPKLQSMYGEDFNYAGIRQRRKELMQDWLEKNGIEKKKGVDEILPYLKKKGFKIAVATATDEERATSYLKEIGIYHWFDRVICANMVENGKPMPDIYLYACEQIGEKPKDCYAVEDSPNGVKAAALAGCRTIMVPDLSEPDKETEKLLYAKVTSLLKFKDVFSQENQ
ncbi:HAD family hydrolase [Faecalimonas sp.]